MKAEFGLSRFVVSYKYYAHRQFCSRVKLVCFSLSFDSESTCTGFLVLCSVCVCVCVLLVLKIYKVATNNCVVD